MSKSRDNVFNHKILSKDDFSNDVGIIPSYSEFTNDREPSLNFGMKPQPIPNMTILPNQIYNSLNLLAQTDPLTVTKFNKNTDITSKPDIVSSNEIEEPFSRFQTVATPFIKYDEYPQPESYFNNFNGSGKMDLIKEYICHVNSIDRDINKYPSPFNFLVKLSPVEGETDAYLTRTFKNIRYIKIETAVFPRRYCLVKTIVVNEPEITILFNDPTLPSDNQIINNKWIISYAVNNIINYCKYEFNCPIELITCYECIYDISSDSYTTYQYCLSLKSIEHDKYSILYLNDINDISQYSTDQNLSKAFNVMYPDNTFGNSLYVDCHYTDKIFKFSELGNINRMLIRITNSLGQDINPNTKLYDYNVPTINSKTCTCTADVKDYKCLCTYIRHPRYSKTQIDIMFKFGIIETDFDKRVFN